MRIIGGKYRGKKLFAPEGVDVRPTGERAREALFSILYSRLGNLEKCDVLDVFAGTGAFGLEAISRGANSATFIDINPALVSKNAALFQNEQHKINIIRANALKIPLAKKTYNLLFMDAPYAKNLSEPTIQNLSEKNWLANDALCIIETRRDEALELKSHFLKIDERLYGLACIHLYMFNSAIS